MKPTHAKKQLRLWALIVGTLFVPIAWVQAADNIPVAKDAFPSGGPAPVIHNIRVVIDGAPGQQETYAAMAKRLIRLHPGTPLNEGALQAAIEALKLSKRFSAIHVDAITESAGETLTFTLTPYRYIKDIRIRGNYPLFERDIFNQMTLYPGDPYTRADLSAQTGAIAERYKREGYIDPKVSVKALRDTEDENAVVLVDIRKGPHYVLGALKFEGNRAIASESLQWRMKVWRSAIVPGIGRFSEYRLKKDMASLLKYYRKKGFADAELSYRIDAPQASRQVDVSINVQEGQHYEVAFEGNQHFWDLTLKKDVAIFTNGNLRNTGVRKSVQNMKLRYHEAGFLDARIKSETTIVSGTPVETRQLRFVIQEGPQTVVNKVTVAGNQALSESEIKKQILTRPPTIFYDGAFVPETLETDTYAVTTLYMRQGFQERTVNSEVNFSEDNTSADVALNINEGPRTTVRSIVIHGLTVLPEADARNVLVHQIGDPFRDAAMNAEKEAIASLISEKGYPHAAVNASVSFSEDRTRADIVYDIDAGPPVTMGDIFVSGNLRTAEKIIQRELEFQPQTPLSLQSLYDGQRRLRDLEIFHGVNYRTFGLKEKEETVDLFVEIEENEPYYAQVGAGYQSDSGFFSRVRVGDRNLFGLNKDLWASGEISQTGYRVETRLTEPRFLGTRTTASIGAFNEESIEFNQPFGTRTTGGSLGFGRDWGKHVTTALSFRLEKRDQFSVEDRAPGEAEEETRTIFVTTPYVRYDSRDSFVRPTSGLFSSLSLDISKGIQNQLDDFFRYQFDCRYYKTPFDGITFAGLARIGQVIAYADSDLVPDDQLFFLGGIQDVRGYNENLLRFDGAGNPVGGKTAVVGSLEARIDLGLNFELTTFFDVGSVQNALVEGGTERFRSSVGIGLRYITPIGPMGLLYGHKLDREEGESAGRLHLSIGYSF